MASGDSPIGKAVVEFLYEKHYRHVKPLGKGSFGEVLSAISPLKDEVAVKIVVHEKSWKIEEYIWPILRHENILPLSEMIDVHDLGVKLYVMPKMPYALCDILSSDTFTAGRNGLRRVKRWLSDVLDGLKYLHKNGFAHLDLKEDNVLISADDRALLCDFSGLNLTGIPLQRTCAPLIFCPPEYYDCSKNMEGSKFDIWLYGLMALNILTDDWPSRRMVPVTDSHSWKTNVEPVLLEALKKRTFCKIMKSTFPYSTDEELTSAHDFVASLMQWDMDKRPSVQEIENHPFVRSVKIPSANGNKKSVTKNPFLDGMINSEKYNVNAPAQESTQENDKKNDTLKGANIVRNSIQKGWIDYAKINEKVSIQKAI